MRACHAAGPGSIPGRDKFRVRFFRGFSSPVRQMSGSFRPPRSPNVIWSSLSSILIHYGRQWPEMLTRPKTSNKQTRMMGFCTTHAITISSLKWKNHCEGPDTTQDMNLSNAIGRSIRKINKDTRADGVRRLPNIWQKLINKVATILKLYTESPKTPTTFSMLCRTANWSLLKKEPLSGNARFGCCRASKLTNECHNLFRFVLVS